MVNPNDELPMEVLARRFERFGELECRNSSPLYENFSLRIAADSEMLQLASYAKKGQPVPNLLFAAVHYLLLQGLKHPLADFYPSLNPNFVPPNETAYPHFRAFCLQHRQEIQELIETRLVQTNEVQRCACLLPAFGLIARQTDHSLALIEIGSSAGLNLLWDRYQYDYGEGRHYGNPSSPVRLTCEVRGKLFPPLPAEFPKVASRLGVDLNPIDVKDSDATAWLRALIWPEHLKRAALLEQALQIVRPDPPTVLAGNALDLLPGLLASLPPEVMPCVFHTFTVNQFPVEARQQLAVIFADYGATHSLAIVSIGWHSGDQNPQLNLTIYDNGSKTEKLLAHCDGHANWIEWQNLQNKGVN